MLRKAAYLLISILLLFNVSGCSSNTGKATDKEAPPVYAETDIGSKMDLAYISQIKLNSKGQLMLYGTAGDSQVFRVTDENGGRLSEIKCDFKGDGRVFALDKEDNLYVLVQDMKVDQKSYKVTENTKRLLVYNKAGEKLKEIELGTVKMQNEENIAVQDMVLGADGNIYLVKYNESPEVIDLNGKTVNQPYKDKISFLDIDDEGNLITGLVGNTDVKSFIGKINPKNGNKIWKTDLDVGVYIRSVDYSSSGKCIRALADNGVLKYDSKGNFDGKVLEFIKYGLMSDKIQVSGMAADEAGNIYLLAWDSGANKSILKKYSVAKPGEQAANTSGSAPAQEAKTLTLSAHFSDRWLESAIGKFQASHPGVTIDVKDYKGAYYGDGDTPAEADKRAAEFVKTINTELMAGKGPDIICFTDLPYRKYVDKNAFCNLTELMEKDKSFNSAELNMNILDGLKYKGALYTMPVNYQFDLLVASKAILDKEGIKIDDTSWTWKDFMGIAEKVTKDLDHDGTVDQFAFADRSGNGVCQYMYKDGKSKFIDIEKKKADFMNPDFLGLLKISKEFKDKKLTFDSSDWGVISEKIKRGGVVFNFSSVPGYSMIWYYKGEVFAGDVYVLRMPSDKETGSRIIKFGTGDMLAINSNSKYKDEAWEFMKVLLSKDMQASSELRNGFPVNNEALKENASPVINILQLPKGYVDTINAIIPDVREYDYSDSQVSSILSEETDQFFSGKKSAEDAARAIQNKLSTYLGE